VPCKLEHYCFRHYSFPVSHLYRLRSTSVYKVPSKNQLVYTPQVKESLMESTFAEPTFAEPTLAGSRWSHKVAYLLSVGVFAPQQKPGNLEEGATRCEWGVVLYLGNGGVYCDQENGDFGVRQTLFQGCFAVLCFLPPQAPKIHLRKTISTQVSLRCLKSVDYPQNRTLNVNCFPILIYR